MSGRFLIACALAFLIGCGKQKTSSPSPADSSATAAAGNEAQTAALLSELTQQVRKYAVEQHRAPKTLEELVANGYLDAVPPAPTGKRFAINKDLKVYLADR